jgi:hypothetical protein
MKLGYRRDYYAGALMMLLGAGAALEGSRYHVGSLTNMGPGFFPTALGILLAIVGVVIAGSASYGEPTAEPADIVSLKPDWRGWFCVSAGALLFIVLAAHGGMVPATLACVFVAALGDRNNSWKQALLLAVGVTVFGTLLFSYGLRVQIPIFGSI